VRAWLVALRIARREARRAKGRSALVVALIGLPVLAFTFFAVTYDTFNLRPAEKVEREMGAADIKVTDLYEGPVKQEPTGIGLYVEKGGPLPLTAEAATGLLPAGSRIIPWTEAVTGVRTKAGRGRMVVWELDYTDPLATGILRQLAGRAPSNADEVALTRKASDRIGAGVGGTLSSPDGNRTWKIVGLVENPLDLRGETIVFRPDAAPITASERYTDWLADTPSPMTWPDVVALNKRGGVGFSRVVAIDPPPYDPATMPPQSGGNGEAFQIATMFAGALVLEVVLLAAPAFAVGARRRRRDLALVAATGGSPAHLRRIVLADGIVLGAIAAALGVVLGIVVAFATRPLLDDSVMNQSPGAFRVYPMALLGLALLAVGSGLLAALVPAWTAARQPVVAALRGLYAVTRLRRRWAALGLATLAGGIAITAFGASRADDTLSMAGMVLGEIGLVLCTPALVGLVARLGSRFPLSARIALRDVGRNRAAAAPAISAVLAAVAVSTLAGVTIASGTGRYVHSGTPLTVPAGWITAQLNVFPNGPDEDPPAEPPAAAFPALQAAMTATTPVTTTVPISRAVCADRTQCDLRTVRPAGQECPYTNQGNLSREKQKAARNDPRCETTLRESYGPTFSDVVIDPTDLGTLVDLDRTTLDAAVAILRQGGVLVADRFVVSEGQTTISVSGRDDGQFRNVRLPALVLPRTDSPVLVMSPESVTKLGLTTKPAGYVGVTDRVPTQAEKDAFLAAAAKIEGSWQIDAQKPPTPQSRPFLVVLAIVAGIVTIGAAGIATGLAAAEGRADMTTLAAVGASPGVRRMLSLSRTGIVAGLGSVLGLLAGLGAAAAVITGSNRALESSWPDFESPMPFVVPWLNVLVSLVVVPVAAMLGAALFTRARLPIERPTAG
jgi:putative ABC transport system permease protein